MDTRWFITLFIALSMSIPSVMPFVREVQQVEWCIVIDLERNAYRRLQEQAVRNDE